MTAVVINPARLGSACFHGKFIAYLTGRRLFLSHSSIWTINGVKEQLPQFRHIADFWHAREQMFPAGEPTCAGNTPRARQFGRYWSKRLRRRVAATIEVRLHDLLIYSY